MATKAARNIRDESDVNDGDTISAEVTSVDTRDDFIAHEPLFGVQTEYLSASDHQIDIGSVKAGRDVAIFSYTGGEAVFQRVESK